MEIPKRLGQLCSTHIVKFGLVFGMRGGKRDAEDRGDGKYGLETIETSIMHHLDGCNTCVYIESL